MTYGYFKELLKITISDTVLPDEEFDIAKYQNMMDIKEVLLQWFTNFLIKS